MIGATPTLLTPAQIDARLATIDQATGAAVAAAARPVSPAPIAAIARAASIPAAQQALQLVPRPIPAAVRVFSFQNFH